MKTSKCEFGTTISRVERSQKGLEYVWYLGNCSTTLAHTASRDSAERISGLSTVRSWLSWRAESDIVPDNVDDVMGLMSDDGDFIPLDGGQFLVKMKG